ncbi:PIN domain-like protein, partial [Neolentinus lepideus HHB14362 ss-1]
MGVPGLWDILRPSGQVRSLTHLAVVDGFEANRKHRGLRIGIDASIWFFHAAYGKEGENPELRTLFFRCCRLMTTPFLPLFVFDGPKRPKVKRGKRVSGNAHWLTTGMKNIIEAFGFEWRTAPGEAEAELAYLSRIGVIDAILSDDVDNFLFGATMVIRNPSATLSGNKAHPVRNSAGRDDGNHSVVYTSSALLTHPDIGLTLGGLILIGLLSGGDYHQAGLARCGMQTAHALARCGFGDSLLEALLLPEDELDEFLKNWRQQIRNELKTNSKGYMARKNPSLAKAVPEDFPDIDILISYAQPITSESEGRRVMVDWTREPDLGKVAGLCELYFEWGVKDVIIKRFRTVLWPSAVLRILRRAVLNNDEEETGIPSTPRKKSKHATPIGTPSSMIAKHFSTMQLHSPTRNGSDSDEDDEERLIVKIHSERRHPSTDGVLEYRVEIAPAQLVRLSAAGVKGIRPPESLANSQYSDDDEENDEEGGSKKKRGVKKPPPDPDSHLRVWMPATMLQLAEPALVKEYEDVVEKKAAKKKSPIKAKGATKKKATGKKAKT